jgi:hypothetical protein
MGWFSSKPTAQTPKATEQQIKPSTTREKYNANIERQREIERQNQAKKR